MLIFFAAVRDQVRVIIWLTQFHRGLWRLVQGVLSNRASFVVTQVRQGRKQVVWMLVGLPGLSPLLTEKSVMIERPHSQYQLY